MATPFLASGLTFSNKSIALLLSIQDLCHDKFIWFTLYWHHIRKHINKY